MLAPTELDRAAVAGATRLAVALQENLARVIRGKPDTLRLAVVALLSGGHLLIEDVPGVGKTLLAKALARSVGGSFGRVQATPDLLPVDVTGVSVFHRGTDTWEFRPGPVFANVVLVDEINRATPRTQAALLEAMVERQVTVDGATRPLPAPFFLVATQNPHDHAGTFPLPESQRDRFAVALRMGYPEREAERDVLLGHGGIDALDDLDPVTDPAGLAHAQGATRRVHCAPAVADYVLDVAVATRQRTDVALGASPRAALSLLHASQAQAAVMGRHYVTPDDVKMVTIPVMAHRVLMPGGPDHLAAGAVLAQILGTLPVPRG